MSNPISRVLYLAIIYLGIPLPACSCDLPSGKRRAAAFQALCAAAQLPPCLVLLQMGFTLTQNRYRPAGELLPRLFTLTACAAVVFCCTILRVTPTGRYPASSPFGARTFLMKRNPFRSRDCLDYSWFILFI
jgi:hypothetical protein